MSLKIINLSSLQVAEVYDEVLAEIVAHNDPPHVFQRGARLVRLYYDPKGRVRIEEHGESSIKYLMARSAEWVTTTSAGQVRMAAPPRDVARMLLTSGEYPGIPELDRVVTVPVFGPDGSVQEEPGYHSATRTFYAPAPDLGGEAIRAPGREAEDWHEVQLALRLILDELLVDFPFEEAADQAHALCLLLTPFVRELIDGPTPLYLIRATDPGTGKTLLMETCLGVGAPGATLACPSNDAEMEKTLVARLRTGAAAIRLDNMHSLAGAFQSRALAAALTMREWEARELGKSRILYFDVKNTWAMTANNPRLSSELSRRTCFIRLGAQTQEEFTHKLPDWASAHRRQLVEAALTIGHHWVAAGSPRWRGAPLKSYEDWSAVMGGMLQLIGVKGFLENRHAASDELDEEGAELLEFMGEWRATFGDEEVSAGEVLGRVRLGQFPSLGNCRSAQEVGARLRSFNRAGGLTNRHTRNGNLWMAS